jgi:hypothetical protein
MTPALPDDELWGLAEPLLPVTKRRFRYRAGSGSTTGASRQLRNAAAT